MQTVPKTGKAINAPAWMVSAMAPFIARVVVNQLIKDHPGWDVGQIEAKLRADLGPDPGLQERRLLAEILRRWPGKPGDDAQAAPPAEAIRPVWRSPSSLALIAANLLPLYGVLALGWDVFALVLLYWIENVTIGVLNAARMFCVDPGDPLAWAGKLFFVPFFCLHYGLFTAVHGGLVIGFFGPKTTSGMSTGLFPLEAASQAIVDLGLEWSVLAIAASHVFSFLWNYLWRGEFRRASLTKLMMQPYGRVLLLHAFILTAGFAALALGSPVWALVPLLLVKIWLDLMAHRRERRVFEA